MVEKQNRRVGNIFKNPSLRNIYGDKKCEALINAILKRVPLSPYLDDDASEQELKRIRAYINSSLCHPLETELVEIYVAQLTFSTHKKILICCPFLEFFNKKEQICSYKKNLLMEKIVIPDIDFGEETGIKCLKQTKFTEVFSHYQSFDENIGEPSIINDERGQEEIKPLVAAFGFELHKSKK